MKPAVAVRPMVNQALSMLLTASRMAPKHLVRQWLGQLELI